MLKTNEQSKLGELKVMLKKDELSNAQVKKKILEKKEDFEIKRIEQMKFTQEKRNYI